MSTIQLKRRASGAAGAPSTLKSAEPAYNMVDRVLYLGYGDDGTGKATSILPIGGEGAFVTLGTAQTVPGAKTFSGSVALGAAATATAPAQNDNSASLATTGWVQGHGYISANQPITLAGDVTGTGTTAITATLATTGVNAGTYSKVTVDPKGRVTAGANLAAADVPMLDHTKISDFDTQVRSSRLDQMAAPASAVSMAGVNVSNLADPVANTDAATKQWVVNQVAAASAGVKQVKDPVRVLFATNQALSGVPASADGVTLAAGDRVLLTGQTNAPDNCIWQVQAAAWTRPPDLAASSQIEPGTEVLVNEGTVFGGSVWRLTTTGALTLGTTALAWSQVNRQTTYGAGNGLVLTGSQFAVVSAGARITVGSAGIDLGVSGVAAGTYFGGLAVDAYGRITAASSTLSAGIITNGVTFQADVDGGTF